MPAPSRCLLGLALATVVAMPLAAQGSWVPHEDPCELNTGHFTIRGATLYLKQAIETRFPDQRDARLAEAHRVLMEAITEQGQEENAAAWYYLGRYYNAYNDIVGADTAFTRAETLAPSCASDIARYRSKLASLALNDALRTWGEAKTDSAEHFFSLARRHNPTDAELPLYLGMMYSSLGQLDSAAEYVALGVALAETDTAHDARRKQAMLQLAQAYETKAYEDPVVIRIPQSRLARDSIVNLMPPDSTRLVQMMEDVAEIRARGRQLDPESQQVFAQESTAVTDRLVRLRAARDSVARLVASDSLAIAGVLEPTVRAYQAYLERYPDDGSAAMSLARLYSAGGDEPALEQLVEQIVVPGRVSARALTQGGAGFYGEGRYRIAVRLLEAALAGDPNDRNALLTLARAAYAVQDLERVNTAARKLAEIDPLNPNSMRMIALGWALAGNRDSVNRYVALADTGIAWRVNVRQVFLRDSLTTLSGGVRNLVNRPLPAITLHFDFMDASGAVLFSVPVSVPALDPRASETFSVRHEQGGAVSWRYRKE